MPRIYVNLHPCGVDKIASNKKRRVHVVGVAAALAVL